LIFCGTVRRNPSRSRRPRVSRRKPSCVDPGRLRGIAPFGVRTFLLPQIASGKATLRPSKINFTVTAHREFDKLRWKRGAARRLGTPVARVSLTAGQRGSHCLRETLPAKRARKKLAGDSARTFPPAPVVPSVNYEENEEDAAEAQKDDRPGLARTKLPEASGEFSKIHAGLNLHQSALNQKGRAAISLASALPVEGLLFHGIQVPDKQDHHE